MKTRGCDWPVRNRHSAAARRSFSRALAAIKGSVESSTLLKPASALHVWCQYFSLPSHTTELPLNTASCHWSSLPPASALHVVALLERFNFVQSDIPSSPPLKTMSVRPNFSIVAPLLLRLLLIILRFLQGCSLAPATFFRESTFRPLCVPLSGSDTGSYCLVPWSALSTLYSIPWSSQVTSHSSSRTSICISFHHLLCYSVALSSRLASSLFPSCSTFHS